MTIHIQFHLFYLTKMNRTLKKMHEMVKKNADDRISDLESLFFVLWYDFL